MHLEPLSTSGRIARVLLGTLTAAFGAVVLALLGIVAVQGLRDGAWPLLERPGRALGGLAALLASAGLFGALVWMGARRVVAGIRGHAASSGPPRAAGPVFVSRGTRDVLTWLVAALVGGAVLAASAQRGALAVALLGLGGAGLFVLSLTAPARCAFCGAERRAVRFLLTGRDAAICDGCAPSVLAGFAAQHEARGGVSAWCDQLLHALPRTCPRAISRPFLERLAGPDRSPHGLRTAAARSLQLGNAPLARELLAAIPEAEREDADWIDLGVALEDEGRLDEALAVTLRATADASRPWVLNNCAWYRARREGGAPAEALARWLADVEEARRLLEGAGAQLRESLRPSLHGTEAELRRLAGDAPGALAALDRARALRPWTGEQLLTRARALLALGRTVEAQQELEGALRLVYPESGAAREARALLASNPSH
jgi:hypothetical protein